MAIKGKDELYSGIANNGSFAADDAANGGTGLPENTSVLGFLKNLKISSIVDNTLNRSIWLRTMFFQRDKAFVHKIEDKATAAQVGGNIEPDPTINSYVSYEQLPSIVTSNVNDFTVATVPSDGVFIANQPFGQIMPITSGKNKIYQFLADPSFIKLLKSRLTITSTQSYYVDSNSGNDVIGDGSILKPYKTLQYAAHRARIYTGSTSNPVTINVYGGNYTVTDSDTTLVPGKTIIGNLWINGGWNFFPGNNITFNSTSGNYLFNASDASAALLPTETINAVTINQVFGNMVVRGSFNMTSTTGGCIRQESVASVNYSIDFDGLSSTTIKEFLYIDKVSGADSISANIKNINATTTGIYSAGVTTGCCIYTKNKPVLFVYRCSFGVNGGINSGANIEFSAGVDTLGIYSVIDTCSLGANGVLGQIKIGRNLSILDIVGCTFYGRGDGTYSRDNILITATLTSGGYIRLYNNKLLKRATNEISTPVSTNGFIHAVNSATLIAVNNDLHGGTLIADAGATLTIKNLHPSTYGTLAKTITSTVYPATFSAETNDTWNPAFNFWI